MKLKKHIMPPICLIIGLMLTVSCNESDPASVDNLPKTPPKVPVAKSIAFNLPFFKAKQSSPKPEAHYQHASQTIKKIKYLQSRQIELVQNMLENADTTNAKELKEGKKWQWKYSTETGRLKLNIRLVAIYKKENKIKWKVFITTPSLQGQEIRFITGTTNNKVTNGIWTYYTFPRTGQPQHKFAVLDWRIEKNKNLYMKLKLLAAKTFQGGTVIYAPDGSIRIITLNPANKQKTKIKFNLKTNVGFVIDPNYNGGQKACWNVSFKDVPCSKINLNGS